MHLTLGLVRGDNKNSKKPQDPFNFMSRRTRYSALAFLAITSLFGSASGEVEAMRVATTLFEDLGQSDLVVLGKVVGLERAGGLNYVEVEVAELIYGRTDSATVSVIAHEPAANTGDVATVVAPAVTLGETMGEHVLVFLKKASVDEFPWAGMKGTPHFVPFRKVDLRGLQDRQGYLADLKRLAEAVNVRDPKQREVIFLDLLTSHHYLP